VRETVSAPASVLSRIEGVDPAASIGWCSKQGLVPTINDLSGLDWIRNVQARLYASAGVFTDTWLFSSVESCLGSAPRSSINPKTLQKSDFVNANRRSAVMMIVE
jgi:hypothetical protein